jgi:hypothetical protein
VNPERGHTGLSVDDAVALPPFRQVSIHGFLARASSSDEGGVSRVWKSNNAGRLSSK